METDRIELREVSVFYRNFPAWDYSSFNRKKYYSFERDNVVIFPCFMWFYSYFINIWEKKWKLKTKQ